MKILFTCNLIGILVIGCSSNNFDKAWELYQNADLEKALSISKHLKTDSAKHLTGNIHQLRGEYTKANNLYSSINSNYSKYQEVLINQMNIYLHHLKDLNKAKELATLIDKKEAKVFTTSLKNLMSLKSSGKFIVPMNKSHPLNPYIPHVKSKINGIGFDIAFDTGGSYLFMSKKRADELSLDYDIENYFTGKQGFSTSKMWISSIDDFSLGDQLSFSDVPIIILEEINTEIIIFGTNIIKEMHTTIDYPNNRFIFITRDKKNIINQHKKEFSGKKMDFIMWNDHYMMGQGFYNNKQVNMFFDSGLVVVGAVDGQIAQSWMCLTQESMQELGIEERDSTSITTITKTNDNISFAGMSHDNVLLSLSSNPHEFGGINCDLLISHGLIQKYAWSIDFDEMTYTFK